MTQSGYIASLILAVGYSHRMGISKRSLSLGGPRATGVETFRGEYYGHAELLAALSYAFMSWNICLLLSRWSTR